LKYLTRNHEWPPSAALVEEMRNITPFFQALFGEIPEGSWKEDSEVFVNLGVAQNLTGRPNKVQAVQVSALCFRCPAETIAREIQYAMPDVEAKSVRQLVSSENMIMMRLENMMGKR
jgi:hypothetical protein